MKIEIPDEAVLLLRAKLKSILEQSLSPSESLVAAVLLGIIKAPDSESLTPVSASVAEEVYEKPTGTLEEIHLPPPGRASGREIYDLTYEECCQMDANLSEFGSPNLVNFGLSRTCTGSLINRKRTNGTYKPPSWYNKALLFFADGASLKEVSTETGMSPRIVSLFQKRWATRIEECAALPPDQRQLYARDWLGPSVSTAVSS